MSRVRRKLHLRLWLRASMPVVDLRSDFDAFPHLPILLTPNEPGNMQQLLLPSTYGEYEFRWQKLYEPVYRLKGCFGVSPPPPHFLFIDPFAARSFDGLRCSIFAVYFEQYAFHIRADLRGYVIFIGRREKCYHGQSLVFSSLDAYKWPDYDIPQTTSINGFVLR
jgi:hypothetical protein